MMMLSLTFWLYGVTTSCGTAALSCSAAVLVVSPGKDTSSFPACNAAWRVPRSTMGKYFNPIVERGTRKARSEEHTSELQSRLHLVCRLLLEKKKTRVLTS